MENERLGQTVLAIYFAGTLRDGFDQEMKAELRKISSTFSSFYLEKCLSNRMKVVSTELRNIKKVL